MGSSHTNVPPPPPISGEEKALLNEQTNQLRTISGLLGQQASQQAEAQNLYKRLSGLYDANGNLDQARVDALRKQQDEYGALADQISSLQSQRYLQALKGDLPVSEATKQSEEKNFNLLKEKIARQGGSIEGDTAESAVGLGSAASQNLGEFNRTYALIKDAERRGELASGGMGVAPGTSSLNSLSQSFSYSPGTLIPGYGTLASGYGSVAQPYADQRLLGYQAQLQQASLNSRKNPLGGGLAGAGTGAAIGTQILPGWGTAIGAGVGGLAGYLGSR